SGQVIFDGRDLTAQRGAALRAARCHFQMVFQDPYSALNTRMRIGDALAEPLVIHKLADRGECAALVADLLASVGLPPPAAERYPRPLHPYTNALPAAVSVPDPASKRPRLRVVGEVPDPSSPPPGCPFHPRCPEVVARCREERPLLREVAPGHFSACHLS